MEFTSNDKFATSIFTYSLLALLNLQTALITWCNSWKKVLLFALAVCVLLAAIKLTPGDTFENLEKLVGREKELREILGNLTSPDVNVLTVWGLPGMGKSLMAWHAEYEMKKRGYTTYYIRVENFTSVVDLNHRLNYISQCETENAEKWAQNLLSKVLLILDNVDGTHWADSSSRRSIKEDFIDQLSKNSPYLKILVTSQSLIQSQHKGRSYKVRPLSLENCILLACDLDKSLTYNQSSAICNAVGCLPLAVKLVVNSYLPIEGKTFEETANDKEEVFKTLVDISELSSQTEKLQAALSLTFSKVRRECQITCFLLYKYTEYFTRNDANNSNHYGK